MKHVDVTKFLVLSVGSVLNTSESVKNTPPQGPLPLIPSHVRKDVPK